MTLLGCFALLIEVCSCGDVRVRNRAHFHPCMPLILMLEFTVAFGGELCEWAVEKLKQFLILLPLLIELRIGGGLLEYKDWAWRVGSEGGGILIQLGETRTILNLWGLDRLRVMIDLEVGSLTSISGDEVRNVKIIFDANLWLSFNHLGYF